MGTHGVRRLSVLIVEDDPDAQSNLRDILELDGYEVELASSAQEVTAFESLGRFAVILLDRRLPDGNGDELLPFIRESAPDTAVVLVTGHADLEGAVAALRHGAVDFLAKPIEPDVLRFRLNCIRQQCGMRNELAEAQRQLIHSERLAAIGQTVAALSHEARNELNSLKIGLALLPQILHDDEHARKIIGRLQNSEERLQRLFDDVRCFAAPLQLDSVECDIREVWRKAWSSLEPAWKSRDVLFEEEPLDFAGILKADVFRLEQVFRNLFENSLAACREPVVISVSCVPPGDGKSLSLGIRDNGPGLTAEQKQKVFEAFYTTKSNGTGLGMAIAKQIVEAHGGTIALNEDVFQGAEFVITLPLLHHRPLANEPVPT